jgi:hypothetical protein
MGDGGGMTCADTVRQSSSHLELLKEADGGNPMARPRAADDFAAIRARTEELRRERETIPPDEDGTDKARMAVMMRRRLQRLPT